MVTLYILSIYCNTRAENSDTISDIQSRTVASGTVCDVKRRLHGQYLTPSFIAINKHVTARLDFTCFV